ncbi:16S rRNA (cytidine(1402)-2'-O)-methyltransferase [Microbacterium sp. YY-01]|uniref:16S rRNA (cytidine(1402)-2'-O)-methyltransferase n=1 Tax=Microbacterium sp. YY-01 TaxID=3421634 RepID=UPI003D171335
MIILAATPIGNLGDASTRLREVLENATTIAAEDTRTTQRLLGALSITNRPQLVALHDHNEKQRAGELAARAEHEDIVVLSDAGMPTVSDPGYALVTAAVQLGVTVTAIPGPSAVITALAVSGLATDRFSFDGFVPRKAGDRASMLKQLAIEQRTMVFFESPARLAQTLADMAAVFGADRQSAVCRELTKLYEEVRRGSLDELAAWAAEGVRGEIVIVVAGAPAAAVSIETALVRVQQLVAEGTRLKTACADVAAATGLSSRDLYQAVLAGRS